MAKYISCRFKKTTFTDYFKCNGKKSWDAAEYAYALLNYLNGDWYEKLEE